MRKEPLYVTSSRRFTALKGHGTTFIDHTVRRDSAHRANQERGQLRGSPEVFQTKTLSVCEGSKRVSAFTKQSLWALERWGCTGENPGSISDWTGSETSGTEQQIYVAFCRRYRKEYSGTHVLL